MATRRNSDKRDYVPMHRSDLEYHKIACPPRDDAAACERSLKAEKRRCALRQENFARTVATGNDAATKRAVPIGLMDH